MSEEFAPDYEGVDSGIDCPHEISHDSVDESAAGNGDVVVDHSGVADDDEHESDRRQYSTSEGQQQNGVAANTAASIGNKRTSKQRNRKATIDSGGSAAGGPKSSSGVVDRPRGSNDRDRERVRERVRDKRDREWDDRDRERRLPPRRSRSPRGRYPSRDRYLSAGRPRSRSPDRPFDRRSRSRTPPRYQRERDYPPRSRGYDRSPPGDSYRSSVRDVGSHRSRSPGARPVSNSSAPQGRPLSPGRSRDRRSPVRSSFSYRDDDRYYRRDDRAPPRDYRSSYDRRSSRSPLRRRSSRSPISRSYHDSRSPGERVRSSGSPGVVRSNRVSSRSPRRHSVSRCDSPRRPLSPMSPYRPSISSSDSISNSADGVVIATIPSINSSSVSSPPPTSSSSSTRFVKQISLKKAVPVETESPASSSLPSNTNDTVSGNVVRTTVAVAAPSPTPRVFSVVKKSDISVTRVADGGKQAVADDVVITRTLGNLSRSIVVRGDAAANSNGAGAGTAVGRSVLDNNRQLNQQQHSKPQKKQSNQIQSSNSSGTNNVREVIFSQSSKSSSITIQRNLGQGW